MRFLSDVGISRSTTQELRRCGHSVLHLREEGLQRLSDPEILDRARQEKRIVLTFDLDFGDLLAACSHELPSVIIFRLQDQTPSSVTPRLLDVIHKRKDELEAGAILVVEEGRYRLRRLPIQKGS